MGVKWTESRDTIVTDWSLYRVETVGPVRYTEGTQERKGESE